jgi:hypothetical protein
VVFAGVLWVAILGALLPAVDAAPPTVSAYWHEPKYPRELQPIAINASVSDPDGVAGVDVVWCYYPPGICSPPTPMADDDGDGVWGYQIGAYLAGTKAYYNVTAWDTTGDTRGTEDVWLVVVSTIEVTLERTSVGAYPGDTVTLNGTALYDGNATLTVESSEATLVIEETGDAVTATTDAAGKWTLSFPAPAAEGVYHLSVTVNNTTEVDGSGVTLSGTANATLTVSAVPLPDLLIQSVAKPASLLEGQQATFTITVANGGNTPSGPSLVVLKEQGSPSASQQKTLGPLGVGGTEQLVFQWVGLPGNRTFEVRVDPEDAVAELDESNNAAAFDLHVTPDADGDGVPDAEDPDADGDGLPDAWENRYGLDPLVNDAGLDPDGDGLTNLEEYGAGTDPTARDTDGDGYADDAEIEAGTDPTSGLDHPGNALWVFGILVLVVALLVADLLLLWRGWKRW